MTKAQVKRLEYSAEKVEFITKFLGLMTTFKAHVQRVIAQYRAVHTLKDSLAPGHVTIVMDFSENWTSCTRDEI